MGYHSPMPAHRREATEREIETLLLRVELLIARLDRLDGDPDSEANGDEADGSFAEDDFCHFVGSMPGCPVADPGGCEFGGLEA